MMSSVPTQPDITFAHALQKAVTTLRTLLGTPSGPSGTSGDEQLRAVSHEGNDELERLEIWAGEHGVRAGQLDHKLREAPHLRHRVLSLLGDLSSMTTGS